MQLGVFLPQAGSAATPEALRDLAQGAEALGFDSLWAGDHLVLPLEQRESHYPFSASGRFPVPSDRPWLEPFTQQAYLAAVTERVQLGMSVCILPYRHPIENAKMGADLDYLSGGRFVLGAGAGWMNEEFAALGIPYAERGPRTDEQLQAIFALWEDAKPSFRGRYYQFENVAMEPKPVQQPRPPVWIGGNHRPSLRRAARFGDAWHPTIFQVSPADAASGMAYIRAEAARAGRNPGAVGLTLWAPVELAERRPDAVPAWERGTITGTPDDIRATLAAYRDVGVTHTILVMGGSPARRLRELETVMREVKPGL
jgi:probable F420-dependent oxidoreductase